MVRRQAPRLAILVALIAASLATPAWGLAVGKRVIKRVLDPKSTDLGEGTITNIAGQNHLSRSQYHDVKGATLTLLKRFHPERHFFVGLGRDPAPIIAFLQNLGGRKLAVNFPASSNNGGSETPAVMRKYVRKLIPPEAFENGRTIVFVDVSSSGRGMDHYVPLISPHLKGAKIKQAIFAVSNAALNKPQNKVRFVTTNYPDVNNYFSGIYENYISEYPRHGIGASPFSDLDKPRPEYQQYRDGLMRRMSADSNLDKTLAALGGAFENESPEERKARIMEERKTRDAKIQEAQDLPRKLQQSIDKLVKSLPKRKEDHGKGPYFSDSAAAMNTWFSDALNSFDEATRLVPRMGNAGPNPVVSLFMDSVEQARQENKIRNRDYRRLMGHSLSAAQMDARMIKSLVARFAESSHFKREVTEESDYYLNYHGRAHQAETANMSENFKALTQHLDLAQTDKSK
jgi:hypothetical protein